VSGALVVAVRLGLEYVEDQFPGLWNERAVAYRRVHGFDDEGVGLGVVIQRMVDAASAGVLFTADPITYAP
jgi:pyruvate,water dikinase